MARIKKLKETFIHNLENVEAQDTSVPALAKLLGLYDYQIYLLVKENLLREIKGTNPTKVRAQSVQNLKSNPEAIFKKLSFSTVELQQMLDIPYEVIASIMDQGLLKSYRKKKRKGHMRSLFRMENLLKHEDLIEEVLERYYTKAAEGERVKKINVNDLNDHLHSKVLKTATRLEHDQLFQSIQDHENLKKENNFELDPWQKNAILSIEQGNNIFVQAPTGAGKTAIVEQYITRNIDSGLTLFYAVPIKALANDKYFDFCDLYGKDNVGINTGDVTINGDAPIVVGTTEIVRNIIFDRPDAYQTIAFDEAQYLGDPERGGAWEESIILSSDHTTLIFLSGSVSNADQVVAWVEKIKGKKTETYSETVRPVPLQFAFPFENGYLEKDDWYDLSLLSQKTGKDFYAEKSFFEQIEKSQMTPVLLFMPRRRDCEEILATIPMTDKKSSDEMKKLLESHPDYQYVNLTLRNLLIKKKSAYHHSGLLPPEKRVVESFAKKGYLRFVAATMSLASGVNFSVRTCFIREYRRPGNGGNFQNLTPSEILQMWGRAGRRGLDTEGYLIPCMDVKDTDAFDNIKAYPEAIERDNFVSPVNLLSILSRYSVETLEELCEKSFSSFVEGAQYRVFSDATMIRDAGSICGSPTYELAPYRQGVYANLKRKEMESKFRCTNCENLANCTKVYEKNIKKNPLQKMVKHLKMNKFLTNDFCLTEKGILAERFHSETGLLVAHHILEGKVKPANLIHYAATVSSPGHIDFIGSRRRLTLDIAKRIYPMHLFPNLWERQRGRPVFINWNPGAGAVAEKWVEADDWQEFSKRPGLEKVQGDLFRVLLRTGELLKSLSFIKDLSPELAEAAKVGYKLIMKPPLLPEKLIHQ